RCLASPGPTSSSNCTPATATTPRGCTTRRPTPTAPHPIRRPRAASPWRWSAMTDLHTEYLGLHLRSPLVASAGPYTGELDKLSELQDAGVAAVVLPSLFEEQIEHETS